MFSEGLLSSSPRLAALLNKACYSTRIYLHGIMRGSGAMPRIRVKLVSLLREAVGGASELILEVDEGAKLSDVLKHLFEKYPRLGKLVEDLSRRGLDVLFVLNGKETNLGAEIKDGDELVILPPASGG